MVTKPLSGTVFVLILEFQAKIPTTTLAERGPKMQKRK